MLSTWLNLPATFRQELPSPHHTPHSSRTDSAPPSSPAQLMGLHLPERHTPLEWAELVRQGVPSGSGEGVKEWMMLCPTPRGKQ